MIQLREMSYLNFLIIILLKRHVIDEFGRFQIQGNHMIRFGVFAMILKKQIFSNAMNFFLGVLMNLFPSVGLYS
jgi:hypothetical protein